LGSKPQTVHPVASHYADYAFPATKEQTKKNKKKKKKKKTKEKVTDSYYEESVAQKQIYD